MTGAAMKSNKRWIVVALLTLGVIIAYTDRINLSAALPAIRMSFPLSAEASGIRLSAFFWAYTLLQTPAGWVVDRFGLKWPYAAGLAGLLVQKTGNFNAPLIAVGLWLLVGIGCYLFLVREKYALR
jgi:sugar phosphate permease